jgi:glycosyltransferase involved in cell wall biosynthesis
MRLSVVILAKNESEMLPGALKSVEWADEVIVGVDTTTTDDTKAIAEQAGAKTLAIDVSAGFASAKNELIDVASQDWVLVLDADERVDTSLKQLLPALMGNPDATAYSIPFKTYLLGKLVTHGGWGREEHIRLIRRKYARYDSKIVHEEMATDGKTLICNGTISHFTHRTIEAIVGKISLYSSLEAEAIAETMPIPTKGRHILLPAIREFIRRYIKLRGYKDGLVGFIECSLQSYYVFISHAKAWEINQKGIRSVS